MNKKYLNPKGFGLIEAMIAMVVTSIISVGIMTVVQNTQKSAKTADQSNEVTGLLNITMQVLDNNNSCVALMGGLAMPTDGTYTYVGDMVIGTTPILRQNFSYSGIEVQSIQVIRGAQIDTPSTPAGAVSKNIFTLELNFQRQAGTAIGAQQLKRDFQFTATTNAAGNILMCHGVQSGGGDPETVCLKAGGDWDDTNIPNCQWKKIAIMDNAAGYAGAPYPTANKGIYTEFGLTSGGTISTVNLASNPAGGTITLQPNTSIIGNGTTAISAGTITGTSDARLKQNIHTIDHALEKALDLRGVYFNWKDKNISDKVQIGVIAQEVEKVLPEVVFTAADGTKSVAYANLVGVLIEAIKEQQKQIHELQEKVGLKTQSKVSQ